MAYTAILLVSNLHCPSCVSHAEDICKDIPGVIALHDVSLINHTIRVRYSENATTSQAIAEAFINAAFEVKYVWVLNDRGSQIQSYEAEAGPDNKSPQHLWRMPRSQRMHIENCEACQQERSRMSTISRARGVFGRFRSRKSRRPSRDEAFDGSKGPPADIPAVINIDGVQEMDLDSGLLYNAMISIEGMTCASCVGTITTELAALDFVESVDVNLVGNNARIVFYGPKENSSKLVDAIEDIGYEAILDDVRAAGPTPNEKDVQKVLLSIEGMTCGSCVGTITTGLKDLPFVVSVSVDLIGNAGTIGFRSKDNLPKLLEKLDDLGYEGTVVKLEDAKPNREKSRERTIQIEIRNMFCEKCPQNILESLTRLHDQYTAASPELQRQAAGTDFTIGKAPTLKDPRLSITYTPAPATGLTVRKFIETINAADPAFSASVYHPPTVEERSRTTQAKERTFILWRLVFTAIISVPTFIIGVVFMSLVPANNSTRMWFEEPIWAGNVMRIEWALLLLTTPVMFFGADMFHRRAFNEIWLVWRPKSKAPFLRRFYRFGSMNLLISAGVMVAYFASLAVLILDATSARQVGNNHRSSDTYFDTVTFLSFFILIGKYLEAYSKAKTGDAVAMLSNLRPTDANLLEPELRKIPADELEVGDLVQIPHGHSPPADGIVEQDGTFLFDESSLTGESRPAKKFKGDTVFTGTVNLSDPVKVRVTEHAGTSMLDQIVNVVRDGQAKRAPIERFADILTGYFVPLITLLAILTWVIWLGLGESGALPIAWLDTQKGGWAFWSLEFAIAVFVVACPCGLGLAAPTALFVGGGLAAKHGILVQGGGEAFQEASRLDIIVFDKTGTLTQGQMKVTDFQMIAQDFDQDIVLAMSKAMEESSNHPIAKAIVDRCQKPSVQLELTEIKEVAGQGMAGSFVVKTASSNAYYQAFIGNEKMLSTSESRGKEADSKEEAQPVDSSDLNSNYYLKSLLQKQQSLGYSTAIFGVRKLDEVQSEGSGPFLPIAVFSIADPIRPEAPRVLQALRSSGLEVYMCTGDNQTTATAIASQLGIPITHVRAGYLPQQKAAYIVELQNAASVGEMKERGRKIVGFVGDGTNDTPALSSADVSIALSSGSDVAITTASFILLNSDLNTILELTRLAKRVFLRVKLNFGWAAVYNLCLVPVAAGIFFAISANQQHGGWRLGPVWASIAMAASSVSVVMSSLALKLPEFRWKRD